MDGSSEWMVVGAIVVAKEHEPNIVSWVEEITDKFIGHQRFGFHFRDLNAAKKRMVCEAMAKRPMRIFAVASNKKNMQGYENPAPEKLSDKNWFYCWMTRLLRQCSLWQSTMENKSENGQAGVEVTPEMIEAGADFIRSVIDDLTDGTETPSEISVRIYEIMESVRRSV